MYNYLEDKNLIEIYEYLKDHKLYDVFIKSIVSKDDLYKEMIENIKKYKKETKLVYVLAYFVYFITY